MHHIEWRPDRATHQTCRNQNVMSVEMDRVTHGSDLSRGEGMADGGHPSTHDKISGDRVHETRISEFCLWRFESGFVVSDCFLGAAGASVNGSIGLYLELGRINSETPRAHEWP